MILTQNQLRFNRYMVECELRFISIILATYRVLIDTWWNVNQSVNCVWNAYVSGFNRYMVECEYLMLFALMILIKVLIDTWWNVNEMR